jgi:NAD-dependent deacetylase
MPMPILPGLIDLLRGSTRVAVLTGAGVSAESGLPTFRDAMSGLWSQYKPEDLASPEAFERDPEMIWEWYSMRRLKAGDVQPNPGHYALVEMACHFPSFTLITQNVDGLHQRAGSQDVIELHGNITRVRCSSGCGVFSAWDDIPGHVPVCPACGNKLRPDVVWFGEMLPPAALDAATAAARHSDLFISIGTSGLVQPAASLAYLAIQNGARVAEINAEATPLTSEADYFLQGMSGAILPELLKTAWPG